MHIQFVIWGGMNPMDENELQKWNSPQRLNSHTSHSFYILWNMWNKAVFFYILWNKKIFLIFYEIENVLCLVFKYFHNQFWALTFK